MKSERGSSRFEEYSSPEASLVISGSGTINAAIATAWLLTVKNCEVENLTPVRK